MIKEMELEKFDLKMDLHMKVLGKEIKCMEKELSHYQMVMLAMMENFLRTHFMEKGFYLINSKNKWIFHLIVEISIN
jgi:hypothetical protein